MCQGTFSGSKANWAGMARDCAVEFAVPQNSGKLVGTDPKMIKSVYINII